MRPSVCQGVRQTGSPRLGAALRTAERVLKTRAKGGRKAYAKLRRAARKRRRAEALGIHGMVTGAPGAALAAALAAHRREPRDPRHLINASVVLTGLGRPNEALALLKAAERLRFPRNAPMAIDLKALLFNNRGYALIALRRYGAATGALKAAVRREPLLAEARWNLAVAQLCSGNPAAAVAPLIGSNRRNPGIANAATVLPRADQVLDLSQGVPMQLPNLRLPQTPDDGIASAQALAAASDAASQRATAEGTASGRTSAEFHAQVTDRYRAARTLNIWALVTQWQTQRPDFKEMEDKLVANHGRMGDVMSQFGARYVQIQESCASQPTGEAALQCRRSQCVPAMSEAHSNWLAIANDSYAAARTYAADLYTYATGVAANIAHPAGSQAPVHGMANVIWSAYNAYVVHPASVWASQEESVKDDCAGSGGTSAAEDDPGDMPPGYSCPPALKGVKFSTTIPIQLGEVPANLGLSANCESVSAELSGRTPVTPFGNVDYNFAQNRTTVFIGIKGGASDFLVRGGTKNGIYLTLDGQGRISDYGVRAQLTGGTNTGAPIDYGTSRKVEYSLAGMW